MTCWRCERGSLLPDLGGEVTCINCGAPATPVDPAEVEPMRRGPKVKWDKAA